MKIPARPLKTGIILALLVFAGAYKLDLDHSSDLKREFLGLNSEIESSLEDLHNSIIQKNAFLVENLFPQTSPGSQLVDELRILQSTQLSGPSAINEFTDLDNKISNLFSSEIVSQLKSKKMSPIKMFGFLDKLSDFEKNIEQSQRIYLSLTERRAFLAERLKISFPQKSANTVSHTMGVLVSMNYKRYLPISN